MAQRLFFQICTEGGISVSASLTNGNLDWIALCPDVDCECQIKNHFHIGLKVFERKTEEILTEVAADQIFFSVSLEAGKTYLILPRLSHPKLVKVEMRKVEPIFNGGHWFGTQIHRSNPYLP